MVNVTQLSNYSDPQGNEIRYSGVIDQNIRIKFTGSNNRVVISDGARIGRLMVDFDCDNGHFEVGSSRGVPAFSGSIRVGQDSSVIIGNNVSTTEPVAMSATEGTSITIGDDVMIASDNQIRADDGHPIFDVRTGRRANVSRSITIGNHVWLARSAVVLGGATIGDGSVIGYGSIVTKRVPNNCIAVGVPARVSRRDIAWERPHLSMVKPFYKPDASTIRKSPHWALTEPEDQSAPRVLAARAEGAARRFLRPVKALWRQLRTPGV